MSAVDPYRDLRDACDAAATAAENTASVLRARATDSAVRGVDVPHPITLVAVAQGWEQFAVELREISTGEGQVRSTEPRS